MNGDDFHVIGILVNCDDIVITNPIIHARMTDEAIAVSLGSFADAHPFIP